MTKYSLLHHRAERVTVTLTDEVARGGVTATWMPAAAHGAGLLCERMA
jgi:hypothetical protein